MLGTLQFTRSNLSTFVQKLDQRIHNTDLAIQDNKDRLHKIIAKAIQVYPYRYKKYRTLDTSGVTVIAAQVLILNNGRWFIKRDWGHSISDDNGKTWQEYNDNFSRNNSSNIASIKRIILPNGIILFYSCLCNGVIVSYDNGITLTKLELSGNNGYLYNEYAYPLPNGDVILPIVRYQGQFRTTGYIVVTNNCTAITLHNIGVYGAVLQDIIDIDDKVIASIQTYDSSGSLRKEQYIAWTTADSDYAEWHIYENTHAVESNENNLYFVTSSYSNDNMYSLYKINDIIFAFNNHGYTNNVDRWTCCFCSRDRGNSFELLEWANDISFTNVSAYGNIIKLKDNRLIFIAPDGDLIRNQPSPAHKIYYSDDMGTTIHEATLDEYLSSIPEWFPNSLYGNVYDPLLISRQKKGIVTYPSLYGHDSCYAAYTEDNGASWKCRTSPDGSLGVLGYEYNKTYESISISTIIAIPMLNRLYLFTDKGLYVTNDNLRTYMRVDNKIGDDALYSNDDGEKFPVAVLLDNYTILIVNTHRDSSSHVQVIYAIENVFHE